MTRPSRPRRTSSPATPRLSRSVMNLRQLRCFAAVVESGWFSRAAMRLGMAQPGLSLQVTNLEQQLGVTLLVRDKFGARPTEHGERLYRSARRILDDLDGVTGELFALGAVTEQFAVGFDPEHSPAMFHAVAAALLTLNPARRPRLVEATSPALEAHLLDCTLDAAVTYEAGAVRTEDDGLSRRPLFRRGLFYVTIAQEGTAHTGVSTLADRPLVLPAWPSRTRATLDGALEAKGIRPAIVAEADTPAMLLALVRDGRGGTVLPWLGETDPALSWSPITEPPLGLTAVLAVARAAPDPTIAGAVRRAIDLAIADTRGSPAVSDRSFQ